MFIELNISDTFSVESIILFSNNIVNIIECLLIYVR